MRHSYSALLAPLRSVLVGAFLLGVLCGPQIGVARAGEGGDWVALLELRKELGPAAVRAQPAMAIEKLQAFYNSRTLHPIVAADVVGQIAEITLGPLKQPDEAAKILDGALERTPPSPQTPETVIWLQGKATILLQKNEAAAAKQLLETQLPTIEAAANSGSAHLGIYASRALLVLTQAQQAVGAPPAETIALLESALQRMPIYLDPKRQVALDWSKGWTYEKLVPLLTNAGRTEEALRWGRLYFAEVDYDGKAIENAVKPLSGVWAKSGDFASVRAFAAAQTEAAAGEERPNPLALVELPKWSDASAINAEMERLTGLQAKNPQRARVASIISLQIALGQWRAAMEAAMQLMTEDANAPDGTQQVARVFKAHDGSVVRANAFLAYLEGQGKNPVPAFLAEVDAESKAPKKAEAKTP